MPDEEVEHLLRSLPVRKLGAAADDAIVAAIRAAHRGRRPRWWQRRIPLWQAAAACVLGLLVGSWVSHGSERETPAQLAPKTVFVQLDQPLFPETPIAADRLDISRWQTAN